MVRINLVLFLLVVLVVVFEAPAFALSSPVEMQKIKAEAAELEAALLRIKDVNPKRYLRMLELREKNPERYARMQKKAVKEYHRIQKLQRLIPANVSLQEEVWKNRTRLSEIMRNLRKAKEGPERVILVSQMEELLKNQFDLRVRMKLNRLNRAEKVLQKRIQALDAERSSKDEFVSRWKGRLLAKVGSSTDSVQSKNAVPKRRRSAQ